MDLQSAVGQVFSASGPLSRSGKGYVLRDGQIRMALAVAGVMEHGGALVVEAGTGIGKTFAYLVPALLSRKRVLLSTATKALQDQLFDRDIPLLAAALGIVTRVALLKGRSSYLCRQRMELAYQDAHAWTPAALQHLARIVEWAKDTPSGDLADLAGFDEHPSILDRVTSTRENCLGPQCPKALQCHVTAARRAAMACDVLVTNHHLYFSDWDRWESSSGHLLPDVNCAIFDEAHQLNEIGVQFLGRQVDTLQLQSLCVDLHGLDSQWILGCPDWNERVVQLGASAASLWTLCHVTVDHGRRAWVGDIPAGFDESAWKGVLMAIHIALQHLDMVLRALECGAPEVAALTARIQSMAAELDYFSHPLEPGAVRWLEISSHIKLVQAPLDIAKSMRNRVTSAGVESAGHGNRSWIFTSATLGWDAGLSSFIEPCGLQGAQCLQVPSPFDYGAQAALYVPCDFPHPQEATHPAAVAELAVQAARVLGGRILLLTTTLRAMRSIAHDLRGVCSALGIEVLVQGELPKRALVNRFTQGHLPGNGCVLVASASFWEGFDVAGEALQLVMIDRIPFLPPDDPLVQARASQIKATGENPFMRIHVPQAALTLKQGAGRLIRSETDRGILVVCDARLTQTGYGRKMIAALPAMRRLETVVQFKAALEALTKPSTTDPCSV
jgi:ATP-dependent DNA helicase DinG